MASFWLGGGGRGGGAGGWGANTASHIAVPVLSYSIISAYAKTALRMITDPNLAMR